MATKSKASPVRGEKVPQKRGQKGGKKRRNKSPKEVAKDIERRENIAIALELRKQAYTYRQIAAEMSQPKEIDPATGEPTNYGIGRKVAISTVADWVQAGIESLIPVETVKDLRQMHMDRLDGLLNRAWREIELNPDGVSRDATDNVLKIMDRMARYAGLYATEADGGGAATDRQLEALNDRYIEALKADAPVLKPDAPVPARPIL